MEKTVLGRRYSEGEVTLNTGKRSQGKTRECTKCSATRGTRRSGSECQAKIGKEGSPRGGKKEKSHIEGLLAGGGVPKHGKVNALTGMEVGGEGSKRFRRESKGGRNKTTQTKGGGPQRN